MGLNFISWLIQLWSDSYGYDLLVFEWKQLKYSRISNNHRNSAIFLWNSSKCLIFKNTNGDSITKMKTLPHWILELKCSLWYCDLRNIYQYKLWSALIFDKSKPDTSSFKSLLSLFYLPADYIYLIAYLFIIYIS